MPIYARTSGGVYKAISKILTADGSEIGKVVDSTGQIIYEASRPITVTGVPPISFTKSIGKPLVSWDLLGNAQQTGTPSPQSIIMPTFCGVRTGNLFDAATAYGNLYNNGVVSGTTMNISQIKNYFTAEQIGKQITISIYADKVTATRIFIRSNIASSSIDSNSIYEGSTGTMSVTITPQSINDYWLISYGSIANNECILSSIMLNLGSTALPYEPYGYKMPFNNHGDNLYKWPYDKMWGVDGTGQNRTVTASVSARASLIRLKANTQYTMSAKAASASDHYCRIALFESEPTTGSISTSYYFSADDGFVNFTTGANETWAVCTSNSTLDMNTNLQRMLVEGQTPKPYSPYFSETVPVYLGQTQTVRRIKKLVLDGTENWEEGTANYYIYINTSNRGEGVPYLTSLSTHTERGIYVNNTGHALFFKKLVFVHSSLADFKYYLAAQYAAGTPVTVWYVLAEPEIGIVNEPLAKIGDYADELHSTDTAVTIPTTKGNNTLTVNTDLPPSSMTIVYKGRHDSGS